MPHQDTPCYFCDQTGDHRHYSLLGYDENGTCLGRLTPQGTFTRRKIHASLFSEERAASLAERSNADPAEPLTVKVVPA